MDVYAHLTEAAERVGQTLQNPREDSEKWRHYLSLTKTGQLEWREREGHREFCRLQRLAFYRFI